MNNGLKALLSFVLSTISAYVSYYILWFSNIVHYYEMATAYENLESSLTIFIAFLIFNFIYSFLFSYSAVKGVIFQGSYLLLCLFPEMQLVEIFAFFNTGLINMYDIAKESNIWTEVLIIIAGILLPLLFSTAGCILRKITVDKKNN